MNVSPELIAVPGRPNLDYNIGASRQEVEDAVRRLSTEDIIEREIEAGNPFGPYHQMWQRERAPEHVKRMLAKAREFPGFMNARQGFASMDVADFPPTGFTPVTANATRTNLWTHTVWTPIGAGDMKQGKVYKLSFGGIYTSTATQGALTWTPSEGTSATPASNHTLGASGAIAPTASITNGPWFGEFTLGIRAQDIALTAITGVGNGFVLTGGATVTGVVYTMGGTVATNISNAAATALIVDLNISVASQSYTAQWALIRSYN